jgi:hypothetical protein
MKRPARIPSQLSKSLNHRLNEYTLVATAAGVGALVFAVPAEAKVIYTPAHHHFSENGQQYFLDLNHDGFVDFSMGIFTCSSTCTGKTFYVRASSGSSHYASVNGVAFASTGDEQGFAAALRKGSGISGARSFGQDDVLVWNIGGLYRGRWFNVTNHYLGLMFYIKGRKHYGWARMSVETHKHPFTIKGVLTGYAYETVPNKPIIAGRTTGPDVVIQPASLGHLARGAAAIPAWRMKPNTNAVQ